MINWEIVLEVIYAICLLGCVIALILHCIGEAYGWYGDRYYELRSAHEQHKKYVEDLKKQIKDLEEMVESINGGHNDGT